VVLTALGISLDLMRYRIGEREKDFACWAVRRWTKSTNRYGRPAVDIYLSLPVAVYLCDDFQTPTSDETKMARSLTLRLQYPATVRAGTVGFPIAGVAC
jgi:hypothetical protein